MQNPYALLFEPVKIGPVVARNRFYQVPHCNGMGHVRPQAEAALRGIKAEGGWAVVSNQETEIHPTSDLAPFAEGRLWDARDVPALRLMTEAVHAHGSLAAIELVHNGAHAYNLLTRAPILAPSDCATEHLSAQQARAMDKTDIRALRQWHKNAAILAKEAGFDIIYVYAGHNMSIAQHFLTSQQNDRSDEYGGSLINRVRLTRELLEDTREAVGDRCAVAFRFAVDEMMGKDGIEAHEEGRAVVEMLADLPDLWDVNISGWPQDSATTRFVAQDGYQNDHISFVKKITGKPVVGVGRFTSPDLMMSMVRGGVLDLIGAARPSIADPFLPEKIRQNRIEDIRECIGCNICVSADSQGVPIRCTQNPTMGEEWRRGWHPERTKALENPRAALVVGSGPSGLSAALELARRGCAVTLAESQEDFGGRVTREAALPGLSAWQRVIDYRLYQLRQLPNVDLYAQSPMSVESVLETGIEHVFVATGARWRNDGLGRSNRRRPPDLSGFEHVFGVDALLRGEMPKGKAALIYDDDQIYLAGVLAEKLALAGQNVTFVTPASMVSPFTTLTLEQERVQARLLELGVTLKFNHILRSAKGGAVQFECAYSGQLSTYETECLIPVTERIRDTALYDGLRAQETPLETLKLIGDAAAPGLIADAVYSGHLAAREFEEPPEMIEAALFRRELIRLI